MTDLEISILWDSLLLYRLLYCTVHPGSVDFSMLFPAHEAMLYRVILQQETLPDDGNISGNDEKNVEDYRVDESGVA
jgi:hypothetical protein